MKKHAEHDVYAATTLDDVCRTILDISLEEGRDMEEGPFIGQNFVLDVRDALASLWPEKPERDRSNLQYGICFGLVAAMRSMEARQFMEAIRLMEAMQQEADRERELAPAQMA